CAIIAVGHETGGELVRREHGADSALAQRLVEREILTARYPENMIHAVRLEGRTEMSCAVFHLWLRTDGGTALGLAAVARAISAFAPEPMRYRRLRGASSKSAISSSPPSWLLKCVTGFSAASVRSTAT